MTPRCRCLTACLFALLFLFAAATPGLAQVPAVPTNVTASDGYWAGWVRIQWDTSNLAGFHSVWRSNTAGGTYSHLETVTYDITYYNDTSAATGQTYYYKVKSCIDITCSALSNPAESGWRGYLNIVNTINASDSTNSEGIWVIFSSVSNADYYKVWRALTVGGIRTPVANVTSTAFLDDQVTPNNSFYYWVVACNDTDINECGEAYHYDVGRRAWPVVQNVTASDGGHAGFVRVTWDAVSGATGYRVYYSTNGGTTYFQPQQVGAVDSYDYYLPLVGFEYTFAVTPCFSAVCGSVKSATDIGWLDFPPPDNLTAGEGGISGTPVAWDEVDSDAWYYVFRDKTNAPVGGELAGNVGTAEAFRDEYSEGGLPGVLYTYWVVACPSSANDALDPGCSSDSASDTGYYLPRVVQNLAASDGTSQTHVQVTWDSIEGATAYVLERSEDPFADVPVWTVLSTVGTNSFQDTTAIEGTKYWYSARACGADYCGDDGAIDPGYLQGVCYELTLETVGQGSLIAFPDASLGCETVIRVRL